MLVLTLPIMTLLILHCVLSLISPLLVLINLNKSMRRKKSVGNSRSHMKIKDFGCRLFLINCGSLLLITADKFVCNQHVHERPCCLKHRKVETRNIIRRFQKLKNFNIILAKKVASDYFK